MRSLFFCFAVGKICSGCDVNWNSNRETFEECTIRECQEETGLSLKNIRFAVLSNCAWTEEENSYHFVDIVMYAEVDLDKTDEPKNLEPQKCEGEIICTFPEKL